MSNDFITARQVAAGFGVTVATIHDWRASRGLPDVGLHMMYRRGEPDAPATFVRPGLAFSQHAVRLWAERNAIAFASRTLPEEQTAG